MVLLLPFDAHNHVQLGSFSPPPLSFMKDTLSGMAVMSTHPRDFPVVANLAASVSASVSVSTSPSASCYYNNDEAEQQEIVIVPCMGVHPWFLHELTEKDWEILSTSTSTEPHDSNSTTTTTTTTTTNHPHLHSAPRWVQELELLLQADSSIAVGEIGLDNFHFNDPVTKELSSPMQTQMLAMEWQIKLAVQYQRPVSVHCVRAMGSMLEVWKKVIASKKESKQPQQNNLPPRIYFHAFGGKAATVIQLIRLLEPKPKSQKKKKKKQRNEGDGNIEIDDMTATEEKNLPLATTAASTSATIEQPTVVYFGFAPIVNFQSPKTLDVIRAVGLDRLVLETDHEEAYKVPTTMKEGLRVISGAFGITEEELIAITNKNAKRLYMLD